MKPYSMPPVTPSSWLTFRSRLSFRPHIVSEEGSRVRVVVVVLDVQVLVEVTNPNPTPTQSFVFCL